MFNTSYYISMRRMQLLAEPTFWDHNHGFQHYWPSFCRESNNSDQSVSRFNNIILRSINQHKQGPYNPKKVHHVKRRPWPPSIPQRQRRLMNWHSPSKMSVNVCIVNLKSHSVETMLWIFTWSSPQDRSFKFRTLSFPQVESGYRTYLWVGSATKNNNTM